MPAITYSDRSFDLTAGETVLDGLLRNDFAATHCCKAGACGACMMRAVSGAVPFKAQAGLKDSWKAQGYFLPCVCVPDSDITVTAAAESTQVSASIAALDLLSPDVIRVRLRCDSILDYHPGQYVTIMRNSELARSYSIASLPTETEIELHVRRVSGGRMSGWLHDEARTGDRVKVLGPSGDCFYVPGRPDQPLLLAGTGTGLAPLYGILRDALGNGHRGQIHLFHGALHDGGLYLVQELRKLAAKHANFEYTAAVLNESASEIGTRGPLDEAVLMRHPKLNGYRAYVCGDPAIVKLLKKKFFLAGAASGDIYADAFLPAA